MSLKFKWTIPTRIYFGEESLKTLSNEITKLGSKALIITSKGWTTKRREYFNELVNNISINYEVYDEIKTNPTTTDVDKIASMFKDKGIEVVVGFGGGSSIDVAKVVALILANSGSARDYLLRLKEPKNALPIVAIPTTHGTGSEVDRYAVVTDPETHAKAAVITPLIYPRVTIIEPKFTITMPRTLTIATTIDALAHAVEAYINENSNIIAEMYARETIRNVYRYLPKVLNEPTNVEYRSILLWASTCAGIAIDQARASLLHALEHPLSSYYDIHHGLGLYALFIPWLEYVVDHAVEEFSELARLVDPKLHEVKDRVAARKFIELTKKLFTETSLEVRLRDYGVKEGDLPSLVDNAFKYLKALIDNSPRKPKDKKELIEIYLKAL